ncbi:MAG: YraN family protein [Alphaproteobacteria bacterium]|jgi:putative endonuclease|nr:YraN family protein [Alphaproteobacteria bacterium]
MRIKSNYLTGIASENYAKIFLKLKGYKIISNRFKGVKGSSFGEIDIIAEKKNTIHFIEVKRRKTEIEALESITPRQQQRIANTAELFLRKHPKETQNKNCQFDAIAIYGKGIGKIKHLQNAWLKIN